jgi:hypothetical protein
LAEHDKLYEDYDASSSRVSDDECESAGEAEATSVAHAQVSDVVDLSKANCDDSSLSVDDRCRRVETRMESLHSNLHSSIESHEPEHSAERLTTRDESSSGSTKKLVDLATGAEKTFEKLASCKQSGEGSTKETNAMQRKTCNDVKFHFEYVSMETLSRLLERNDQFLKMTTVAVIGAAVVFSRWSREASR